MDNIRLFLFMGLALVLLLLYQAWMQDYGPAPKVAQDGSATTVTAPVDGSVPSAMPAGPDGALPGTVPGQDAPRAERGEAFCDAAHQCLSVRRAASMSRTCAASLSPRPERLRITSASRSSSGASFRR